MPGLVEIAVILSMYRCLTIIVGLLIVYLGYRLFLAGVYEKAGDLRAAWGDKNLTLIQTAPGIFFALFGAVIIAVSLWCGIQIEQIYKTGSDEQDPTAVRQ